MDIYGNDQPEAIEAFLVELRSLCLEHGVVLSHEDAPHGAFTVYKIKDTCPKHVDAALDFLQGAVYLR